LWLYCSSTREEIGDNDKAKELLSHEDDGIPRRETGGLGHGIAPLHAVDQSDIAV